MTCDDCIHKKELREVDKDFNVTINWICDKKHSNIKLWLETSEQYRYDNPRAPLSILYYDKSKDPCKDHKVGGIPLDQYIKQYAPDTPKPKSTQDKTQLPPFLERE